MRFRRRRAAGEEALAPDATGAGTAQGPEKALSLDRGAMAERAAAEELPWIDDRVSKLWVALIAGVFGLIFLYALLFGHAGALAPASPSPSPSPTPVATPTTPTSPTPAASPAASPALSPAASPGGSPAPGSPTPAASPSRAPSPSPAAS